MQWCRKFLSQGAEAVGGTPAGDLGGTVPQALTTPSELQGSKSLEIVYLYTKL